MYIQNIMPEDKVRNIQEFIILHGTVQKHVTEIQPIQYVQYCSHL
jgi:hypothetical protein